MPENDWPDWLQVRRGFIRDDFLADYVSFDAHEEVGREPKQKARLLLVVPGGLVSYRLEYRRVGENSVCQFTSASIRITAVQSVVRTSRVDGWNGDVAEREQAGTIQLDQELEGWDQKTILPLDNSVDYRGSREASAKAAGKFLDTLQSEMGLTRLALDSLSARRGEEPKV